MVTVVRSAIGVGAVPRGGRGRTAPPSSFADRGRASLGRSRADVTGRARAGDVGLEEVRDVRVWAGEAEAVVVAGDGVAEPIRARQRLEDEEQEREPQPLAPVERDRIELSI